MFGLSFLRSSTSVNASISFRVISDIPSVLFLPCLQVGVLSLNEPVTGVESDRGSGLGIVVASISSLSCTFSYGLATSRLSATIPLRIIKSFSGSTLSLSTSKNASRSFTSWSGSQATIIFRNIICPAPNNPRAVFLACLGYLCLLAKIAKLWNPVSKGKWTLSTSLCWKFSTGENWRPIASPRYPSSIGGNPTMVAGRTAFFRIVIAVTFKTGYCPVSE